MNQTSLIKCYVSPELKDIFSSKAKDQGMTNSELLRSLVVGLSETQPEKVRLTVETEIHRFTLRLPKILELLFKKLYCKIIMLS